MGASLIGAGIGAGSSLIGGKKAKKAAANQQKAMLEAQQRAAEWANEQNIKNAGLENEQNRGNQLWANEQNRGNTEWLQGINRENIGWSNDLNRGNQEWAQGLNRAELERQNEANRGNQLWAQGLNQTALDRQLGQNRIGQTNAFGSTLTYDENGNQVQKFGGADQATLDALRGQRDKAIGNMSSEFDVQGDVMNAYRNLQNPLLQESRDKENARLAAMGIPTGSGAAWLTAQRSLNDAQTRADQNAILQGFQANQALQDANRSNLGALNQTEGNLRQNLGQADFWKQGGVAEVNAPTMGAAQVQAPNAGTVTSSLPGVNAPTYNIPGVSATNPMDAFNAGNTAGQSVGQGWTNMGSALGGIAKEGINWFNKPGDNGFPVGYDPTGSSMIPPGA